MIFHFILKLRQKVAFTGWFERFQNRGVGISSHQSLLFLPSRLHLAVMETKRRRYRWDRIAGAGITLATALVLFVAWIAPASVQSADGLVHPGTEVEMSRTSWPRLKIQPNSMRDQRQRRSYLVRATKKFSTCRRTLYTAHRQAARNLPSSFYVKDKSEMKSGKRRGNWSLLRMVEAITLLRSPTVMLYCCLKWLLFWRIWDKRLQINWKAP